MLRCRPEGLGGGRGKQSQWVSLLLNKIINSSRPFFNNFKKNNTLRWSAKDIKKITTLNNRRNYYNFNENLEAPIVEKTQVTKSRFALLRATFTWLAGNQRATDLLLFNKAQWQKCPAVTTDALQLLDETYMQTSGIAHIPPEWTIPFGILFSPLLQKRTQFSEPFVWITSASLSSKNKMKS